MAAPGCTAKSEYSGNKRLTPPSKINGDRNNGEHAHLIVLVLQDFPQNRFIVKISSGVVFTRKGKLEIENL